VDLDMSVYCVNNFIERIEMRLVDIDEPSSSPVRCERRLNLLANYLKPGDVGAELGVFKGSFSEYLLATQPAKLYLVDPWYRAGSEWRWAQGDKSTVNALIKILTTCKEEIVDGIVEPRVEFSQEFLASLPDRFLDWVYIDTTHTYEQTKLEVSLALSKVKIGGYIIGDDYASHADAYHKGVYLAVQEYVKNGVFDLVIDGAEQQFVAVVREIQEAA
jgi:hypothetical protein